MLSVTPRLARPLSPREKDCLHWVSIGKTTEEISLILGLSQHTVNFHLRNACKKLNASNRAAAIANAFHAAIFTPQSSKHIPLIANAHYNQLIE